MIFKRLWTNIFALLNPRKLFLSFRFLWATALNKNPPITQCQYPLRRLTWRITFATKNFVFLSKSPSENPPRNSELANISNKLLSWGLSQELNSNEKDFFAASLPLVPSLQASETSAQWINIGFPRHLIGLSGKAEKVLSERVVFLKTDEHRRFQLKTGKIWTSKI